MRPSPIMRAGGGDAPLGKFNKLVVTPGRGGSGDAGFLGVLLYVMQDGCGTLYRGFVLLIGLFRRFLGGWGNLGE